MRHATIVLFTLLVSSAAIGQSEQSGMRDDVPIDAYLALLKQVAPAARDGAESYMKAFRARCGRPLRTIELRRAFAEGGGDATLLAVVRASHEKDEAALQRLGAEIKCPGR